MKTPSLAITVPDTGSNNISNKALFEITEDMNKAPISIRSTSLYKGTCDYIPGEGKIERQLKAKVQAPKWGEQVHTSKIRLSPGVDYRSYEDSKKADTEYESRLLKIARQVYSRHEDGLKRYKMALSMVEKATDGEKLNPSPQLQRAIKLCEEGPPITKKKARELAEEKLRKESL